MNYTSINQLTYEIIACAMTVHSELGPGLLESVYEQCLEYELRQCGMKVERQKIVPVMYKGRRMPEGFRLDLLVNDTVIIELKAVETVPPIDQARVISYLKLMNKPAGLILNFRVERLRDGIIRLGRDVGGMDF